MVWTCKNQCLPERFAPEATGSERVVPGQMTETAYEPKSFSFIFGLKATIRNTDIILVDYEQNFGYGAALSAYFMYLPRCGESQGLCMDRWPR